jgi:hypothetical protein
MEAAPRRTVAHFTREISARMVHSRPRAPGEGSPRVSTDPILLIRIRVKTTIQISRRSSMPASLLKPLGKVVLAIVLVAGCGGTDIASAPSERRPPTGIETAPVSQWCEFGGVLLKDGSVAVKGDRVTAFNEEIAGHSDGAGRCSNCHVNGVYGL